MDREIFDELAARLIEGVAPGKNVTWFAGSIDQWWMTISRFHSRTSPALVAEAVRQMVAELDDLPSSHIFLWYVNDVVEDQERLERRASDAAQLPAPFAASREEATATLAAINNGTITSLQRAINSGVWDRSYARSATLARMRKQAAAAAAQRMIDTEVRKRLDTGASPMTAAQIKALRSDAILYGGTFSAAIRPQDVTEEMVDEALRRMSEGTLAPRLRGTLEAALAAKLPPLLES